MTSRRASTLIELMVVMAIMAVIAGVVGFALGQEHLHTNDVDAAIRDARRAAIRGHRATTVDVPVNDTLATLTAFPDGSILADRSVRLERLTGKRSNERR